jgi:hypothetical protein
MTRGNLANFHGKKAAPFRKGGKPRAAGTAKPTAKSAVRKSASTKKGASKNFIAGAIKHPGALHAQLGVPQGKKIPAGKLAAAAKKGGKLGQRARFAEMLKGLKH